MNQEKPQTFTNQPIAQAAKDYFYYRILALQKKRGGQVLKNVKAEMNEG
ncbi:MAG: hypothetical protein ABSB19_01760 [Methylomonas sp.]|jgi:hypothetical protein